MVRIVVGEKILDVHLLHDDIICLKSPEPQIWHADKTLVYAHSPYLKAEIERSIQEGKFAEAHVKVGDSFLNLHLSIRARKEIRSFCRRQCGCRSHPSLTTQG